MTPALAGRPGFLIRRLHQIHLALFAEECAPFGITPVQYSIMTIAAATPDLDQAQLAQEAGIDRATLANVVARLEKKFLVRRRPSVLDKRVKLVSLSPRGAALLEKMRTPAQRAHDRTIAPLPPKDRQQFLSLLIKLVNAQNGYGRAPLNLR
jgi:DNA-binding MarR family transcriptional regulator